MNRKNWRLCPRLRTVRSPQPISARRGEMDKKQETKKQRKGNADIETLNETPKLKRHKGLNLNDHMFLRSPRRSDTPRIHEILTCEGKLEFIKRTKNTRRKWPFRSWDWIPSSFRFINKPPTSSAHRQIGRQEHEKESERSPDVALPRREGWPARESRSPLHQGDRRVLGSGIII